ncbi:MAG: NGG1p interacting factor NIF3 [Halopseudomonas sp.]
MYKLEYYVPHSHLEATKQALFNAGAGRIGDYSDCCWVTEGTGQFTALEQATPFIGQQHQVHQEPELKVELVFAKSLKQAVISALKQSHPYETPAYQIIAFES